MAIRILKEVSRDGGRLPTTGKAAVIAGQPLELGTGGASVHGWEGNAGILVFGLASDSNVTQPLQGAGGLTVGVGYDYTNFNRGGLIGAFMNGGVFELYNDGTGNPFETAAAFTLNKAVYANAGSGLLSDVAGGGGGMVVGSCMGVTNSGSATAMKLQLKLTI